MYQMLVLFIFITSFPVEMKWIWDYLVLEIIPEARGTQMARMP